MSNVQSIVVSTLTVKNVNNANRQSVLAQNNVNEACRRSVRLAYSTGSMVDANYVIANLNKVWRSKAVSFFKQCGIVVIENRGEMPRADRVADKTKQARVFETLAGKSAGNTSIESAEDIKAKNDKRVAKELEAKEARASTPVKARVLAELTGAFARAQKSDDYDVQTALGMLIDAYKTERIVIKVVKPKKVA